MKRYRNIFNIVAIFSFMVLDTNGDMKPFKGNGKIFTEYIRHKENRKYIFQLSKSKVRIFLRARSYDVSNSFLIYKSDDKEHKVKMTEIGSTRGKQYFYVDIDYSKEKIEYHFLLKDGKTNYYFGRESGYKKEEVENFQYTFNREADELNSSKDKGGKESLIWYQIEIDRFRKGYPYNSDLLIEKGIYENNILKDFFKENKKEKFITSLWTNSWSDFAPWEESFAKDNKWYTKPFFRRYGGDIQGIIDKLDYIKSLGVDVIVLSPIFYAYSAHKYDVVNHLVISPDYCNVKEFNEKDMTSINSNNIETFNCFKQLVKEIHARDMKVVIDFPMNTGINHFAFKDVMSKKENSKYLNWYFFEEDGSYKSMGEGLIPCLNHNDVEVREYLLRSLKNITYMDEEEGIDGIVFDSNSFEGDFIEYLKDNISKDGKDILFISNPIDKRDNLFTKNVKGSSMEINYRVNRDLMKVFKGPNRSVIESLKATLELNRLRFIEENMNNLIVPTSTFDTERIYSSLINLYESNVKSQENSNYKNIRPDIEDNKIEGYLKIATLLTTTYIGSPMILYGDELGMWGAADPDNRKQMLWDDLEPYDKEYEDSSKYNLKRSSNIELDKVNSRVYYKQKKNKNISSFFKKYFNLRNKNIKLFTHGNIVFPKIDREIRDSMLIYYREYEGRAAIILINFSDKKVKFDLPLPKNGTYYRVDRDEAYTSSSGMIEAFEIDRMNGTILFLN